MGDWTPGNREYPPPKPGEPPLHRAARMGDADAIERLVREGSDVNALFNIALDPGARPSLATPLMVAAGSGDGASVDTVKLLLSLGADPAPAAGRDTAAVYAARGLGWNYRPGGDIARLKCVLDAGSRLPSDPEGSNRVMCGAAEAGDPERVQLLLDLGLSPHWYWDPEADRRRMRSILPNEAIDRHGGPSPYALPLHRGAESGNEECVRRLLRAGAEATKRDCFQQTAMYWATTAGVVRVLRNAGVTLDDKDSLGRSPLTAAADRWNSDVIMRALLEGGADANTRDERGATAFLAALQGGAGIDALRRLLAEGADPHATGEGGQGAFHVALHRKSDPGDSEWMGAALPLLKQLGVDIEQRDEGGCTPLASALFFGAPSAVRVLCDLGADPNAVCGMHTCGPDACARVQEPLIFHVAEGLSHQGDVKLETLIHAGARTRVRNRDGFSPLECAVAKLCHDADDYAEAYDIFFLGLGAAKSTMKEYVEGFASAIPIRKADAEIPENLWREIRRVQVRTVWILCEQERLIEGS